MSTVNSSTVNSSTVNSSTVNSSAKDHLQIKEGMIGLNKHVNIVVKHLVVVHVYQYVFPVK